MIWHSSDAQSVLSELSVDANSGLANGVAYERLATYGKNQVAEFKPVSFWRRFLNQLNKKSVYALAIITAVCVFISGAYGDADFSYLLIIGIAVLDALLTSFILNSCDRAVYMQKAASIPVCTVLREGVKRSIPSNELVPGDIILLSEGDYIGADVRLIETNAFRCNELALTGEIIPAQKDADILLEDLVPCTGRKNMAYCGCNVTHGTAKAVVVETGINTEIYKSTAKADVADTAVSNIENKLNVTSKIVNVAIAVLCAIAFLIGMIFSFGSSVPFAQYTLNTVLNVVALGIAAIPESLPYITVLVTALGAVRLIGDGVIIKNTKALEKLAKTTVLCADKTGVFTKNHMRLNCIFNGEALNRPEGGVLDPKSAVVLRLAVSCSLLENDSTELAIEEACRDFAHMSKDDISNAYPRLASIPFDGERKMMTSINMIEGKPFAVIKGAPEAVLEKCVEIDIKQVTEICEKLANNAFRLICIAIKALDEIPANPDPADIENNLKFAGIICLDDPPRTEAASDIEFCRNNGVNVIMVTGDNLSTALAVARDLNIIASDEQAITGAELDNLSDEELKEVIGNYKVFARISPAQKLRIVTTLQSNGETVTVTGNGLDDADVLSVADVGMAIGAEGNDVARGNADAIIKKNNFSAISSAFKECYGLFDNIKKTVHYLLSCNASEILIYITALIIFKMPPLLAVQLLWINLLTDAAPAISLTIQPADDSKAMNSMRLIKGKLFDAQTFIDISVEAAVMTLCGVIAFAIGNGYAVSTAYTMTFLTVALSQVFHSFNLRSAKSVIETRYKRNEFMVLTTAATAIVFLILCVTPAGGIFGLKALSAGQLFTSFALSLIIVPVCEGIKAARRFKTLKNGQGA